MIRVLLLGGTSEATALAHELAGAGVDAVFSYAGRTAVPVAQPLPTRVGGFGGAGGMADYIRASRITHVVDATHPFAAQISRNAVDACLATGAALCALVRPEWVAGPGDDWRHVADTDAAVAALPDDPARVFLAIGKQTLAAFAAKPQHHYLLRLVDPPQAPLPLPDAAVVIARGPFALADDLALLQSYAITYVVAKNAGGAGAESKLKAALIQQIPVILIDRPRLPPRQTFDSAKGVMDWIALHSTRLGL